jgi:hypothetical protein
MTVRAHCPDCEQAGRESLREVTPTGEPIGTSSSRWWRLVMHADGVGGVCPGSGKRV